MTSSKEVDRLTQVSELSSAIRQKYETLKQNELQFQMKQEKSFKPILQKADEILGGKNKLPPLEPISEQPIFSIDDYLYGIKANLHNEWVLGHDKIRFTPIKIYLRDSEYNRTDGLVLLPTRKNPINYTSEDLENYKKMLIETGAHLKSKKWNGKT